MALMDGLGRGIAKGTDGTIIVVYDSNGKLTARGRDYIIDLKEKAEGDYLLKFKICLVTGGAYNDYLSELFECYDKIKEENSKNNSNLTVLFEKSDTIVNKLKKGFTNDEDRKEFLIYTSIKRSELLEKLK